MPFIPHTDADVASMLSTIGIDSIDALFDEIPQHLRLSALNDIPDGINEMSMLSHMATRAKLDDPPLCFLGAGCYDHHIPAAVWDIASRGEFLTAYTPYQAEASQGTLQLLYEFQSMLASLSSMDVANASVYDGATALAESILMAIRINRKAKTKRVLVPATLHPHYLETIKAIVPHQGVGIEIQSMRNGTTIMHESDFKDATAVILQQPNFFGQLESVDEITDLAHAQDALVIAVVNPMSLALLNPPGEWGEAGADIVCGDGQPLGIPMASGGPSFGFLCSRMAHVRQLPGRIAGKTQDANGNDGFVLTLQAREQHIRRAKATSNICTNQGLLVTAATIYMSLLGPTGMKQVATSCYEQTHELVERLDALPGVERKFKVPFFHECVLEFDHPSRVIRDGMLEHGLLAGLPLDTYLEDGENAMLVCATEKRTNDDIMNYVRCLEHVRNTL